ncbi:MAG: hypothetical protein LN589_01675, partial [Rickettsia endosymbiont of Eriopis connexa]|nr:hypothetical protein [Rickettsia endosymbiont of Eriopis connexa]
IFKNLYQININLFKKSTFWDKVILTSLRGVLIAWIDVIPAKAGIQSLKSINILNFKIKSSINFAFFWIPAFAGMT